ncbi:MAG TPA: peptidoglycan DD-metalloendopeptidase family protein [Roseiarcus sp.]|nr:peptidoglycan DD-metalloendopeptidase family protein [Roseiarcus sp.]
MLGAWLAGCSSDSTRFSDAFSLSDGTPTPGATIGAASPTPNANYAAAAHPSPVAVSSLPAPAPTSTGSIRPTTTQPITGFNGGWSTVGGSPIVLADGENLETISRRYGVPQSALLRANGLTSASEVHPGARLIVPVYNAGAKTAAAEPKAREAETAERRDSRAKAEKSAKESKKAKDKEADASEHKKQEKAKVAEAKAGKAEKAEKPAKAEKTEKAATVKTEPARKQAEAKPDAPAKKTAATDQTPTGSVHPEETTAAMTSAQADAAGVTPEFRWPARGRIIQGFKVGGNDGINIAVPEGTSVKAAESGVVAYAGNELKGYGNLILIRHPNGFVTAYANNGELEVKRGEQVKRGQIIAKSGQSGNVSSPQLHFELRKGSTPVDPTSYLAGL